ncbi:TIGR03759 family integrating conjugative element protein [Ursidibacter maritimus]|uniref:TIGR03759 family integrating conjugative element protein n=2 Tax=Ursidibacter maritimus TaxID=1331689 RepID=A0A949WNK1_9PAST|nr:TIGR03759 family integrating conjugative element protein [Ursidibacter maritimus]MBV6524453.1 TIGR03759 family integrating conjugative element protein [Ursidibacter maritimus]MBV6526507.1 TIGR03759 family integrating conjugative element protein [Ursidibacter maritimus]MBV6527089.1 TIGR03759 family integrating conjugative element protein [Ursidibacter maritimus]MBV6530394.1 TIGR03759 family integrating conjugative element protein [Ursidibacter maritimus]MBV6531069.1 TIGR03759 family integrat
MTSKILPMMLGMILVFPSPSILANTSQSSIVNTLNQSNTMQQSVEQNLNVSNSEDKWSEWGLTRDDWSRYELLKKGARGIWSPSLDPLTTLGIEARSDTERDRYAELLAKKEFQRVEKEFAFQIAYNRAFERLYPNVLPFKSESVSTTSAAIGRIIYFTRTDCDKCVDHLTRLWSRAGNNPVDIYIVDSMQDDNKIQQWAVKNRIDINKVKNRQITLNHDSGYWLHYANGKMPAAFIIQGNGEWQSLVY